MNAGETVEFINYTVVGYPPPTLSYRWYRDSSLIAGVTSSSYRLQEQDVSKTVSLEVTVRNIFNTNTYIFPSRFTIESAAGFIAPSFLGTPSPSILGATVGDTVSVQNSGATGIPDPSITFAWYLNGTTIDGQTASSYTTEAAGDLESIVTATNVAGTTSATVDFGTIQSFVVAPAFTGTPSASIVGSTVGIEVSITDAGVTGVPEPTVSYAWYNDGVTIDGATNIAYTPVEPGELEAIVTANNVAGTTSATVDFGTIALANVAPSFISTPTASVVGGTVGDTLTVTNAGATGIPDPDVEFAWYLDGATIDGQTGSSYTTEAPGDIESIVTATNVAGTTSATVDFGTIALANVTPSFTGTPSPSDVNVTVGTEVSVTDAGVTGVPEPTVSYDWYLDGTTIDGVVGSTYETDTTGDLEAIVTATNIAGTTSAIVDFGTIQGVSEEYSTDFSALAVDISGVSGSPADLELNGFAYANVTGASVDVREEANYTYSWYREIPELTGIMVEIQ